MTCLLMRTLIEPCFDGELDANGQAMALQHMADCELCRVEYGKLERLRADLRDAELSYAAPAMLRERVLRGLRKSTKPAREWPWREMAIAASVLLAISAVTNVALTRAHRSESEIARQEIVTEHLRSMMSSHLLDVVSSDRHTVKPWFSGKLDFAPEVKDLAQDGFPLAGGRVDYMDARPVAALVFRRAQHIITLFTWPSAQSPGEASAHNGFNVVGWSKGGMIFWAVSDLNRAELETFAGLYKK